VLKNRAKGRDGKNEIGAAISPALVDSCFWAIVTFSGVVCVTTRQQSATTN
jgi:hypothetical protein